MCGAIASGSGDDFTNSARIVLGTGKEFQFFRDNLGEIEKLVRDGKINTDRKRPYSANELRKLLGMSSTKSPSVKSARAEAKSKL